MKNNHVCIQYVVKKVGESETVFVIEANPRASRTVPFVSKAIGVPLVKVASRVMLGESLADLRENGGLEAKAIGDHISVKEAVLPFNRFPETDAILGPEMRSTGEVMGIDITPGLAFAKSQIAAGMALPETGTVFLSFRNFYCLILAAVPLFRYKIFDSKFQILHGLRLKLHLYILIQNKHTKAL